MNKLIWKELREQRSIPIGYAAVLTTAMIVWFVMGNYVATHGGQASDRVTVDNYSGLLLFAISWSGLVAGSSMISSETASGTATFLAALPLSRWRIWCTKIAAAGLIISGVSVLLMAAVYLVVTVCLFGHSAVKLLSSFDHIGSPAFGSDWISICCTFVIVFAIANLVSGFLDRPLAALGTALILTIILMAVGTFCVQELSDNQGVSNFIANQTIGSWTLVNDSGPTAQNPNFDQLYNFPQKVSAFVSYGWAALAGVAVTVGIFAASFASFKLGTTRTARQRFIWPIVLVAFVVFVPALVFAGALGYFYLARLAISEFPHVTAFRVTLQHPNVLRSKRLSVSFDIDYARVQIGRSYEEDLFITSSRSGVTLPITAKTYSRDISASIVSRTWRYKNRSNVLYLVHYVYRPVGPTGNDIRAITVLSGSGKTIGSIVINAHKPLGFFPPRRWFGMRDHGVYIRS